MADNGRSPIHIKKELPEMGLQINCFGNTAPEVLGLLSSTLDRLNSPESDRATAAQRQQSTAQREVSRAENAMPKCPQCGSFQTLDVITFTDQKTGDPMARYKCQACKVWVGKAFAAQH